MRVVDEHRAPVPVRQIDQVGDRGDRAVHREHSVGDDEAMFGFALDEQTGQRLQVAVRVDHQPGTVGLGGTAPVDDAGVVALVRVDGHRVIGEDGEGGEVRGEPAVEDHAVVVAEPVGELLLQLTVQGGGSGGEPGASGAGAEPSGGLHRSLDHCRVAG